MKSKLTAIIAGTMLPTLAKLFQSRNVEADGRSLISPKKAIIFLFLLLIIPAYVMPLQKLGGALGGASHLCKNIKQ